MNEIGLRGRIIIRIYCGLGNQLFMYAFGRALSIETGKKLLLDKSNYLTGKVEPRKYLLEKYNIAGRSISFLDNLAVLRFLTEKMLTKYFAKQFFKPNVFTEPQNGIFVNVPVMEREAIYDGFWQCPAYFEKYKEIIKKDLTLKMKPKIGREISEAAQKENSVSIHFRRTDYIPLGWVDECPREYYQKAIALMEKDVDEPRFFVFSDDIEWVKTNYSFGKDAIYASSLGLKDYEELYLMSQCKHHINANSTFSWWGAYLSTRKGIIVSPKKCLIAWDDKQSIYLKGWQFI